VAEVVFALRIVLHVVPFEVDAAAGAFFADRLEEIHGGWLTPWGDSVAFELINEWSTDVGGRRIVGLSHVKVPQALLRAGLKVARQTSEKLGAG
jgi:hypothetical protein